MNGRDCILRSFGQKKDPREGLNSDAKPQSENQIYANQDTINWIMILKRQVTFHKNHWSTELEVMRYLSKYESSLNIGQIE